MRYIKYITALLAFFVVVASCIDEEVVRLSGGSGNCIQLVGRVMPFTDVEVDTRSPKNDPKEYVANTMDLLIFGSDKIWNPNWYHKYYFFDINPKGEIDYEFCSY